MTLKNDGVAGNVLSDLDFGSVLKDSHNKALNALDVNVINCLIPEKYSRVKLTYKDMGDGTKEVEFLDFYGDGTKEQTIILIRDDVQGTAEITTYNFGSQTTAGIEGKYVIMYDDVGSVGIWFDLDNGSTPPSTGADRDIEVDIATGDTAGNICSKFVSTVGADAKFSAAVSLTTLAVVQSSTVGNKTDSTIGNTSLTVATSDGVASINSKYDLIYNGRDVTAYYYWFNIDSTGVDPAIGGKTGIEVALTSSDTSATTATKLAAALTALSDFTATANGTTVTNTNTKFGASTDASAGDTGNTLTVRNQGSTGDLVAQIQVFFDANNLIENIERVA